MKELDEAKYENLLTVLRNIQTHLINLNIRFNGNAGKNMDDLLHALDKPLKVDDRNLITNIERSMTPFKDLIRKLEGLEKTPDFNEMAFIGKRLDNIEKDISDIKNIGITKKVKLDFAVDGYELVKKPLGHQEDDPIEDPNENIRKLLESLEKREAIILTHRYGLLGESKKTLKKTGEICFIGTERTRAIQCKAIRKCRHSSRKQLVHNITHAALKKDILGE